MVRLTFAFFYAVVPYAVYRVSERISGSVLVSLVFALVCTIVVSFGGERVFKAVSDRVHRRP